MAIYIGPQGEVDAIQLDEDRVFRPSMNVGKKGEWLIKDIDGLLRLCDPQTFAQHYRQKFPRPEGKDRIDLPNPAPTPKQRA